MKINIELTSSFQDKKSGSIELQSGTVEDALIAYGINLDEVGFVIHNSLRCEMDSKLTDGGIYKVCPPIIAG